MLLILPGVLGRFMRTQWATSKGEERWERGKEEEQETFAFSHSSHVGRLFTSRTLLVGPDSLFSGAPASGSFFQPGYQFNSSSQRGQVYAPAIHQSIVFSVFVTPTVVFHSPVCPLYHTHTHTHTRNVGSMEAEACALLPLYSSGI